MMALVGFGMLVAALALLRNFRPRPGQVASRPEWIDVSVSILITASLAVGLMMTIAGVGSLWP